MENLTKLSDIDIRNYDLTLEELNANQARLFLPSVVFTSVLMVPGLIGNMMTLYVYLHHLTKPSTKRLFILVLAGFDFAGCAIHMPCLIAETYFPYTFSSALLCKMMRFMMYFIPLASVLILMLISFERYRKVCHPLEWQITIPMARRCVYLIIVSVVILTCPSLVLNGSHVLKTVNENITGIECSVDETFVGTIYPTIYSSAILGISVTIAIILVVCYSLIWRTMFYHFRFPLYQMSAFDKSFQNGRPNDNCLKEVSNHKDRLEFKNVPTVSETISVGDQLDNKPQNIAFNQTDKLKKTETIEEATKNTVKVKERRKYNKMKKITKIMFVVTNVFIVSFLPHSIVQVVGSSIHNLFNNLSYPLKCVYQILLRSFIINYMANPIIYGLMDTSFRRACKSVFKTSRKYS